MEDEKRAAVCLRASKKPMEIVRFLGYKKSTVYTIKKRFDAEVAENGGVESGVGEPSLARKVHKRHNDAADMSDPDFVKKLQRRINKNLGRPIRRLAADLKVDESTIRRYFKEHIRYRSYKMRKGQLDGPTCSSRMARRPTMPR